jgi:serine/threonine protein phosphatase 1
MTPKTPEPKHLSLTISKNTQGRRLVIPDIHGCPNTFRALIEKITLTTQDQLFLLGDYINKGNNSVGVLDFLLELKEKGYQVFALRGNHEQMLLEKHHTKYNTIELLLPHLRKNYGIVDTHRKILPKYYEFISNLPYYYELDNYFLVHAGFNLTSKSPFTDFESMLWMRDFTITETAQEEILSNKTVIIGHTPTSLQFIQDDIRIRKSVICLDNGCVFASKWFLGNLLCLDLDTWELIIQKNIDE